MNELRRAIPFLLLPLLLLAAGCQLLPAGFLVPASPSPSPVPEATADPLFPPDPDVVTLEQLDAQIAAWQAQGIDDYRWQVRFACFCPIQAPIDVVVEDGVIVEATPTDGSTLEPDAFHVRYLTVDGMFAQMRESIVRGGTLEAAYGDFGQPQLVGLDPIPNAIDDELTIETADFTPSP